MTEMLEAVKNYPHLKEIEELKQMHIEQDHPKTVEILNLLLEALAQASSGMYGGGFSYMESALNDAERYINERRR